MAIDLTKKLVPAIGYVRVKEADGSVMKDEKGNIAYARMHSPASKTWQVADAARHRKMMARIKDQGGNLAAAADEPEDVIDFLTAVTEEFIGLEVPLPEGENGSKALVRAIYTNEGLGYIRDGMYREGRDWGAFLPAPPTSSNSGSDNAPG